MKSFFIKMNGLTLLAGSVIFPKFTWADGAIETALGKVETFGDLISLVWSFGSKVLIGLAVLFLILGAFFYMASAGNEDRAEEGKEMMVGSLVCVGIIMLSGVLMRTLHQPAQNTTGALTDLPRVIGNATNILIAVIAAFSLLMLTYSAMVYLGSGGNKVRVEQAHRALRYAIYGFVMGSLAYVIVNILVRFLAG